MTQTYQPAKDAAIALRYDGLGAPEVTATGQNSLAREIIDVAKAHGVPLYEDEDLAAILGRLDLGEEIPETLYRIIAEILAYAFHLQGKTPESVAGKHRTTNDSDDQATE